MDYGEWDGDSGLIGSDLIGSDVTGSDLSEGT